MRKKGSRRQKGELWDKMQEPGRQETVETRMGHGCTTHEVRHRMETGSDWNTRRPQGMTEAGVSPAVDREILGGSTEINQMEFVYLQQSQTE